MKKFLAYLNGVFILFSMVAGYAKALPLVIDCHALKNCIVYVDDLGGFGGSGFDKDHPLRTITAAVNFIKKIPDGNDYNTIYIRGGTYNDETFPWIFDGVTYKKSINIQGGWNFDFSNDLPGIWPTVVNLKGVSDALTVKSANSVITGLEIIGGGGLHAPIIVNNTESTSYTVSILNNIFHDNLSKGVSALAVAISGTNTAFVRNNTFYKNNSAVGPVLYLDGNVTANNNLFYNNTTGSSIQCDNSGFIYNNFFLSETVSRVALLTGRCSFWNNTLARNTISSGDGNGVVVIFSGMLNTVNNNLIAYNTGGIPVLNMGGTGSAYQYNGFFNNGIEVPLLENNYTCDPKFVLSSLADMVDPKSHKLGVGSSCIDKALKIPPITDDYFATLRPLDGEGDGDANYDPGAFEAPQAALLTPVIKDLQATPVKFTVASDGSVSTKITLNINVASRLTIAVHDASGALVNKLVDAKEVASGSQSAAWNGMYGGAIKMVASGDYNVKVTAVNSSGSDTKQVKVTVVNNTVIAPTTTTPTTTPTSPATTPTSPSPTPTMPATSSSGATVTIVPEANRCAGFIDVEVTDTLCPAIKYVKEKGVFNGYPDGSFRAKMIINRAETTKVILLGFGKTILSDDGTNLGFKDVEVGAWYMKYLRTGKNLGIVKGYLDGTFKPAQQVNRVEMLKVYLRTAGKDLSTIIVTTAPYKDTPVSSDSKWYLQYVQYAKNYGLVDATPDGYFYPAAGMNRGDVALLFYRYHESGLDK